MSHRIVGSNFDTMSRETTSQPAASKALPTDLAPQKSSRSLGIFKEQDHRHCDDQENLHVHRTGYFLLEKKKEPNFAMKLALGLDVQTNAKRGGQEGGRVLCKQHRPGAVDGGGGAGWSSTT